MAFALVEGDDLADLRAQAAAAREHYAAPGVLPSPPAERRASAALVPNPLPHGESLRLILPQRNARASVHIYNLLGQVVAEFADVPAGPHGAMLDARDLKGASGLLFYRIESPGVRSAGKILILK